MPNNRHIAMLQMLKWYYNVAIKSSWDSWHKAKINEPIVQ
jgi:hypothetical protein